MFGMIFEVYLMIRENCWTILNDFGTMLDDFVDFGIDLGHPPINI